MEIMRNGDDIVKNKLDTRPIMFNIDQYMTGDEIKRIRKKLNLTQKELASITNSSKSSVERWEGRDGKASGAVAVLLNMLDRHPEYLEEIIIPRNEYPLRLRYMYKDMLCTVIDVDDINQKIRIKNYVDNIMFRAFGKINEPDYEMYEEFLESRCFPRTRDKIKLMLRDMNLPFYDPFLIVERTNGRMAEDDFWIDIER